VKELSQILELLCQPVTYPAALATLVHARGSSYRREGARLLVSASGRRVGSISGGCLEEDLIERTKRVMATGRCETVVYDTTQENDLVWGVGLGCHGVVSILIEPLSTRPDWVLPLLERQSRRQSTVLAVRYGHGTSGTSLGSVEKTVQVPSGPEPETFFELQPAPLLLRIFGAGDDAQPLVRLAREQGWKVQVSDPRPSYATQARFPEAEAVTAEPVARALSASICDERTAAVIMTHHYVHDLPLLGGLLAQPLCYLGLLGPRKRAEKLVADLLAQGHLVPANWRQRLHAPVGLDLGGDTPECVALAIVAELQALLSGRDARPLRERAGPIHP